MKSKTFIFLSFFVWRLILFLPLFVGYLLLSYREGYDYTNIWKFISPYFPVNHFLLYPWANFDGVYYLAIAGNSYVYNTAGFFPFYPILIHIFSFGATAYGALQFFTAFFIANISFLLSLFVLHKLIRLDYSEHVAKLSLFFLIVFPTSFYFGSIYTESIFLLLALLAFYNARKKQWIIAGVIGALLSATKLVGIAILLALLYEFFQQESMRGLFKKDKKKFLKKSVGGLPLFISLGGIGSYMLFNMVQFGDLLRFIHAHGVMANNRSVDKIVLFPQTIFRYFNILRTIPLPQYEWWIALLELSLFVLGGVLLYVGWKKGIRFSYLLFSALCLLIPASSGTFSGLPRYIVVLFPLFITLALIKNKAIHFLYTVVSLILLFILLMFFARGYFVA